MPSPYQVDLTAQQVNEALNKAYDSGSPPTSGETKLVESGVIYDWVVGRTMEKVSVPASAGASGSAGQISYDSDYLYICVATDTWKRVALSTW